MQIQEENVMQNNKYAQSNCTLRVVTTQGTAFCFAWIGLRASYCGQRKHVLDRRTVGRTRFQQSVLLLVPSNLCQARRTTLFGRNTKKGSLSDKQAVIL